MSALNFSGFFCRSLTLHQSLMSVTVLKPIVHRAVQYGLKVHIAFSGTKTIVGWLQRATWIGIRDSEFESKVLHSFKTAN